MYKYFLLAVSLLPLAARAELVKPAVTPPEPPGLSFILPAPKGPAAKLPPKVLMAPLGKLPRQGTVWMLSSPNAPAAPTPPQTPARLLVFREDDRAVTRTIHPLLTAETTVNTILVKPATAGAKP